MKKLLWILVLMIAMWGCGGTNVGHTPAVDIVSSSDPANGEVNVNVKASITVRFDAALDESTITPENIYLTRANGSVYASGAISYDPAQFSITFTPIFPMVAGASYVLTITSGVLTKANGGDYQLSFSTAPSPILMASNEDPSDPTVPDGYNIWTAGADTGAKTRLTAHGTALAFKPLWSPDYEKIAYILGISLSPYDLIVDGNKVDIFVMNQDGSSQANITNVTGIGQAVSPRWARDGSRIYFQYKPDGALNFNIYAINPDGTGAANLTNLAGGFTTGGNDFGHAFKISPDGLQILYQLKDEVTRAVDLHIMNVDGSGDVKLTAVAPGVVAALGLFSPDGTKIYFSTSARDIFAVNIDGTGLTNLTNVTVDQWTKILGVFPDGTKLLYKFGEDPTGLEPPYDLYWMNVDGTAKTKLISASAPNGVIGAVISPDGSKIAYGWGSVDLVINLFIMGADGSDNQAVTDLLTGQAFVDLIWSPDGDKFAYSYAQIFTTMFMNGNINLLHTDLTGLIQVTDSSVADAWLSDWW